jgi:hypothetical protein
MAYILHEASYEVNIHASQRRLKYLDREGSLFGAVAPVHVDTPKFLSRGSSSQR